MIERLRGVYAAITTPFREDGEPDFDRFVDRAGELLAEGCDGLNVLGTTGEATSLTADVREALMRGVARSSLDGRQMLVGVGAAALGDTVRLTRVAAESGFAGALVLPPFYYKPVEDEGLLRFFEALVGATRDAAIPLYLYNFPALSGVTYTPAVVQKLLTAFGSRIAGLKDSSGDINYAHQIAALSPTLDVFPSSEAHLLLARADGPFAGCISATANVTAADCARAYRQGDAAALARATAVRGAFDGLPLVPAIKALVARLTGDPAHARTLPPFTPLSAETLHALVERHAAASA